MVNTVFHFVNDPTFNYAAAVANGDISEYTIVFNVADRSIRAKNTMFGRMSRADIVETLGDISDIIPAATSTKMGGIKIGYTSDVVDGSKTYAVELDENNRAYVNVPWTDTITPVFDDSELQEAIDAQRQRIDNYISDLTDYVQDLTEALLVDAQWVTDNLAEGEIGRQLKDWTDQYMQQYGVWEWKDENDHSQGRWVKTSVLEQTADRIEARVGELDSENKAAISDLELSVNGKYIVDMQSTGDINSATNINTISIKIAKPDFVIEDEMELNEKDFTNVPIQDRVYYKTTGSTTQYFKLVKVDGVVESNATLTTAYNEYTTNNDGNLDKIVKMAASQLQLKTSANGDDIETVSDLASVIVNGNFTGYSGLNNTVSNQGNTIDAQSSLMSHVIVKNGNNYDVQSDIISGVVNSNTFSQGVATATATLSSTVDDHTAAIATKVSKDSNGKIESSVTINADKIRLDGNTFAGTIFADLVNTNTLQANYATINDLNATNANITNLQAQDIVIGNAAAAAQTSANNAQNAADNANAGFIQLAGGNGTFTGNVNAKTLIAGDPNGINIRTSSDKIEFCQGADVRAYFVADGNGMQLHVWDANGTEYTIDFTKWSQVGGSTYTPVRGYYKYSSGSFSSDSDLFKGSDGKYYSYSNSSYTLISSRDVYVQESANAYPSHGTGFSGSGAPIIYAYATNSGTPCVISLTVYRYVKYSISNGVMGSADTSYVYYSPDYPVSPVFSGTSIDMNNTYFGGKFINPQGGSANVRFAYVNGVTKDLGASMQSRTYVSVANAGTAYSTNPSVYDVALTSSM